MFSLGGIFFLNIEIACIGREPAMIIKCSRGTSKFARAGPDFKLGGFYTRAGS